MLTATDSEAMGQIPVPIVFLLVIIISLLIIINYYSL